jgi:hypothetical protein
MSYVLGDELNGNKMAWVMVRCNVPIVKPVKPLSVFLAKLNRYVYRDDMILGGQFSYKKEDLMHDYKYRYLSELEETGDDNKAKSFLQWIPSEYRSPYLDVITKYGKATLSPGEYTYIKDMTPYYEQSGTDHCDLVMLNNKYAKTQRDQLYYLQTRGLSKVDALKLLHGEITSQFLFYLEFHDEYVRYFLGDQGLDAYHRKLNKFKAMRPELKVE